MNKPHVHAALIKAWADGAEIEYREEEFHVWKRAYTPNWANDVHYRIKPKEPVYEWQWILNHGTRHTLSNGFYKTHHEAQMYCHGTVVGPLELTKREVQ